MAARRINYLYSDYLERIKEAKSSLDNEMRSQVKVNVSVENFKQLMLEMSLLNSLDNLLREEKHPPSECLMLALGSVENDPKNKIDRNKITQITKNLLSKMSQDKTDPFVLLSKKLIVEAKSDFDDFMDSISQLSPEEIFKASEVLDDVEKTTLFHVVAQFQDQDTFIFYIEKLKNYSREGFRRLLLIQDSNGQAPLSIAMKYQTDKACNEIFLEEKQYQNKPLSGILGFFSKSNDQEDSVYFKLINEIKEIKKMLQEKIQETIELKYEEKPFSVQDTLRYFESSKSARIKTYSEEIALLNIVEKHLRSGENSPFMCFKLAFQRINLDENSLSNETWELFDHLRLEEQEKNEKGRMQGPFSR